MRQLNMCDWTELLDWASRHGIDWNTAHDTLVKQGVVPMYESHTRDLYQGVCEDYGWEGLAKTIVDGFIADSGVDSVTIFA